MTEINESIRLVKINQAGELVKVDEEGELMHIAENGLVKLDGITIVRRVLRGDKCYLQFGPDPHKMRSQFRKTRYVEIPAEVFIRLIQGMTNGTKPAAHSPAE